MIYVVVSSFPAQNQQSGLVVLSVSGRLKFTCRSASCLATSIPISYNAISWHKGTGKWLFLYNPLPAKSPFSETSLWNTGLCRFSNSARKIEPSSIPSCSSGPATCSQQAPCTFSIRVISRKLSDRWGFVAELQSFLVYNEIAVSLPFIECHKDYIPTLPCSEWFPSRKLPLTMITKSFAYLNTFQLVLQIVILLLVSISTEKELYRVDILTSPLWRFTS